MKIVLRAAADREQELRAEVVKRVAAQCAAGSDIRLSRVFPAGTPGRRGRLFIATIEPSPAPDQHERILGCLRESPEIEEAGPAAEKSPM